MHVSLHSLMKFNAVVVWMVAVVLVLLMMVVVEGRVEDYTGKTDSVLQNTIKFLENYQLELQELLDNNEEFLKFKQYDSSRPLLWMVIFGATIGHDFLHIGDVIRNRYPHLRDIYLRENSYHVTVGGGNGLTDLRYFYDLALLEGVFRVPPGGFAGQRIVEIGGGYGGFVHTFSAAHDLLSYHVVDMAPSLAFQDRYLSLMSLVGSEVNVPYIAVPDTSTAVIESDLLYSFLALDEVPEEDFYRYINQYVTHATRGYLLLASSRERMFKVFESVWAVQPTAIMLPPDVGYPNFGAVNEHGEGISVRIVWDSHNTAVGSIPMYA